MSVQGIAAFAARSYPALARLPTELVDGMERTARPLRAVRGGVLFDPGDFGRAYPLLLAGTARLMHLGASRREILLYRLSAGEHCLLSSSALLGGRTYSVRAVAETAVEGLVLPGDLFRRMVQTSEAFARELHVATARRLELLVGVIEQVSFHRLEQRLAALLLTRDSWTETSHRRLADDLGSSRENVSRILEAFQRLGLVRLARRTIVVADRLGL
ncbi:MAG TPA: Crp/Fnr family transcriptional regulator, partial [Candidatus Polarisedimenticolaceae bacterium]|nr:Crp/Fnr family transcriptional regulator [Candidatus Polarisedimenticolaceae bacterium]